MARQVEMEPAARKARALPRGEVGHADHHVRRQPQRLLQDVFQLARYLPRALRLAHLTGEDFALGGEVETGISHFADGMKYSIGLLLIAELRH